MDPNNKNDINEKNKNLVKPDDTEVLTIEDREIELKNVKVDNIKFNASPDNATVSPSNVDTNQESLDDVVPKANDDNLQDDSSNPPDQMQDVSDDSMADEEQNVPTNTNDDAETLDNGNDDGLSDTQESNGSEPNDGDAPKKEDEKAPDGKDEKKDKKDEKEDEKKDDKKPDEEKKDDKGKDEKPSDNKDEKDKKDSGDNNPNKDKKDNLPDKDDLPNKDDKSNKDNNKPNEKDNKEEKKDPNSNPRQKPNEADNKPKEDGNKKPDQKQNKSPKNNNNKASGGTSFKNRMKNGVKNAAKNKAAQTSVGQKVQSVKNKYDKAKKAVETVKKVKNIKNLVLYVKIGGIALLALLALIILMGVISFFIAIFSPGVHGDDHTDDSAYSETDQKTLEKINTLFNKYPNADAALAMVTVIYPFHDDLWSSDVLLLTGSSESSDDLESEESEEDASEDKEDITSEQPVDDDPYLELFQKWSYRQRLKKVLKKLNEGLDSYETYMKDNYLDGNGYDVLFDAVDDSQKDVLKNLIISDLKEKKNEFINYVSTIYNCTTTLQSVGEIELDEMIKNNNIYVDVKEEACTDPDLVDSCASLNPNPIPLKDYVIGVVNTEITVNDETSIEKVKAQTVMAKSVVLGRYKEMGWELKTDGAGNYVIPIRSNTMDQDYCDYNVGCSNKTSGNQHGPASESAKQKLEQAWNETINVYVYNNNKGRTESFYKTSYDQYCKKGACLISTDFDTYIESGMTYDQILTTAFTEEKGYALVTLDSDGVATGQVSSGLVCSQTPYGAGGVPDDKFVYYSQRDYADVPFCGASSDIFKASCSSDSNSICSAGCGVTSMAMVVSTLSNTVVTPVDMNNLATNTGTCVIGGGTQFKMFEVAAPDYGLEIYHLSNDIDGANEALKYLNKGGLVIANVGPNSPFTSAGHYVVIRRTGGGNTVYVADPNHKELFNTPYDITDFINKGWVTNGWKAFTGPKSEEYAAVKGSPGQATGVMGSPFDPMDTTTNFQTQGNSPTFPRYSESYGSDCHGAIDLAVSENTPIYATDGGTVSTVAYEENGYGNYIIIDHGNKYSTVYGHLNEVQVKQGDKVSKGQQIGLSGNTGRSSGPHLHIELRNYNVYTEANRSEAKCNVGLGLMNITNYINTGVSYVGQNR